MDIDGPLDFESEDLLLKPPTPSKRRKKIIGLDDLVNDYLKENKKLELKAKRTKARKNYYSDDEEDSVEAKLSECVEKCQKEMGQISGEDEIYLWGLQTFGDQKTRPSLGFTELGSCKLLQSFMDNELNSVVELDIEKGEVFLERLLVNGWLLKLVNASGHVEKSIATWAFGLTLYSSKEALSASACDFWTAILSPIIEIKIDWLPSYSEIKGALEIYGFQSTFSSIVSSHVETVNADSDCGGPPHNIRAWIKYVASCTQVRRYSIFSTSEAEELVVIIICLFLDRQLLGLSVILHECMLSVINFFAEDEWSTSCEKVAKTIACRVPRDMNSLRTVESISGLDARGKHLRRAVAFHILVACLDNKAIDAETILRILISINVKDKSCDLFKTYMYLVLTENWLSSNPMLEDKSVIYKLWGVYLRNCSCQITGTDLRSYASKVRSKASYLLQGTNNQ
ncbi:SMC5-SMC6 complex localization factor protein [Actinidia chinensis var. chinensis]|uniref:SMC5-SMC6 complex localization factor protein n=1 Tax=Actinidia chinensis var. chinensis TaxID=1590841 RepID=A0A2R6PQB2_ACTCC|nr:SMC5-SMC6 complex localization factor protein [Actinidia chinensis var. chinensis]